MKKRWTLSIVFIVLLLDQLTKYWATKTINFYERIPVFPGIDLTLVYNQGAAFSILSHAGHNHPWFFTVFSTMVSTLLIFWLIKNPATKILENTALSFLLGGALGNLIDRVLHGYVTDFILMYYKNYHWPVFNLADCAISFGAILLLLDLTKTTSKS